MSSSKTASPFTYRGVICRQTSITTDTTRTIFGNRVTRSAYLWKLSGRIEKDAGRRPFLTSAKACREYIHPPLGRRKARAMLDAREFTTAKQRRFLGARASGEPVRKARGNPPLYSLWEVLDATGHVVGWETNLTQQGAEQEIAHKGKTRKLHLGYRVLTQLPLQEVMLFLARNSQKVGRRLF